MHLVGFTIEIYAGIFEVFPWTKHSKCSTAVNCTLLYLQFPIIQNKTLLIEQEKALIKKQSKNSYNWMQKSCNKFLKHNILQRKDEGKLSSPLKEPDSCKMATRNHGHQTWNSRTHWCITVVGHTMRLGPNPLKLKRKKVWLIILLPKLLVNFHWKQY